MSISFATRGANYINAGSNSSIDNLTALTFLTWVYPTDLTANDYNVMGIGTFGAQTRRDFGYDTLVAVISGSVDCSVSDMQVNANYTTLLNTWQYLALTWAGIGNVPHLYTGLLTSLVAEVGSYNIQLSGAGAVNSSVASNFYVGNGGGADRSLIGRIGVSMVWNRALSLTELIDQQFNPHKTSGNVLYYQCGLNGASTQQDLSGSGNTGTITNGTVAPHVSMPLPWQRRASRPYTAAAGVVARKFQRASVLG